MYRELSFSDNKEDFDKVQEVDFNNNVPSLESTQQFHNFVRNNTPFIIKGYTKKWACNQWRNLDYLKAIFKDKPLPIEHFSKKFNDIASLSHIKLTFEEYLKQINSENGPTYYLSEMELYDKKTREKDLEHLNDDIEEVFYQNDLAYRLFLLGKNTITQMHYHLIYESVIHQVSGRKWAFLFPPNEHFYQMKPYPWYSKFNNWSKILFESRNQEEFCAISKKLGLQAGYRVLLEPGDSLFTPIYWWHIVFGENLSNSFVDFFHSSIMKKYFSLLGLRSMNHYGLIKRKFTSVFEVLKDF